MILGEAMLGETMLRRLIRFCLAALFAVALAPMPAHADAGDINAAARGVVRVIIIEERAGELIPISHGTGFAVSAERILTNAHVVAQARADSELSIGIVPSDGGEAVYARLVAYSPRNDLAMVSTTTPMNLPPLTIAGNTPADSGAVTAVGYPMNVDRAQGLGMDDIFRTQPPVKSRGFLSGRRPSREFDTLLHTAPIGRGNSGGPLLDNCGRVVGVNSFGAESDGTDAEFYFAVSMRELLPFLRANDIIPQVNGLPCRSIAELDAADRAEAERVQLAARLRAETERAEITQREEQARRKAGFNVLSERENGMMLTFLLLLGALSGGAIAWQSKQQGNRRRTNLAFAITGAALVGALIAWSTRPGFNAVEERVAAALSEETSTENGPIGVITPPGEGKLICTVNVKRSRITSAKSDDIPFTWSEDGCVNERTQYGLMDGKWSRIFVPNSEAVVSVSSYNHEKREYRVERYLLGRKAMEAARTARSKYKAPQCGGGSTKARTLGQNQAAIAALLPLRPNERLIYDCSSAK